MESFNGRYLPHASKKRPIRLMDLCENFVLYFNFFSQIFFRGDFQSDIFGGDFQSIFSLKIPIKNI
jgi:hypothetical protein